MTTIDRLIDASVSCVKCGTSGVGNCQCWNVHPTDDPSGVRVIAEEIARDVLDHIDTMYPKIWLNVPKTARTSVRNTIITKVVAALTP